MVVRQVLGLLDDGIRSLPMNDWTIEDVFLNLMSKNETPDDAEIPLEGASFPRLEGKSNILELPTGRPVPPFRQAFTIFYKRTLDPETKLVNTSAHCDHWSSSCWGHHPSNLIGGKLTSCSVRSLPL